MATVAQPFNHDGDDGTTPRQNQRPEGFHGGFNANFRDGMAVGGLRDAGRRLNPKGARPHCLHS